MDQATVRRRQPTTKQDTTHAVANVPAPSDNKKVLTLLCLIICAVFYFYVNTQSTYPFSLTSETSNTTYPIPDTPQYTLYNGFTEYMYQLPATAKTNPEYIKGIIFFAHGCSHSATDWFKSSLDCPKCLGLPEERNMIRYFLEEHFIVITISSRDRRKKCWNIQKDKEPVRNILRLFQQKWAQRLGIKLPIYAFGASSGGGFVGSLALDDAFIKEVGLHGVIVQISSLPIQMNLLKQTSVSIPIMFIPMERDEFTLQFVQKQLELLGNADNILCVAKRRHITGDYFYDQINDEETMTHGVSGLIYDALSKAEYLDENGYLAGDPRKTQWRNVLHSIEHDIFWTRYADKLMADKSPISEEMNVAFALHELTAECNREMREFMDNIASKKSL